MRSFSSFLLRVIPLLNLLTLIIIHGDLLQRMICYCGTDDYRIDPLALACGKIDLNQPSSKISSERMWSDGCGPRSENI